MFLTNNYRTISNLMIYSGGEYIQKILIKKIHRMATPVYWIYNLQIKYNKYINKEYKNIDKSYNIDVSIKPYGNMNHEINLLIEDEILKVKKNPYWEY